MLWSIVGSLVLLWLVAVFGALTLGAWIHLAPVIAIGLVIVQLSRQEPDSLEYAKWKLGRSRRRRRAA